MYNISCFCVTLQMCKGDNSFKQEGDDDSISLLSQLKQSNPQKFKMQVHSKNILTQLYTTMKHASTDGKD